MSSARHTNFNRAVVLSLLMVMMTQVGFIEQFNPLSSEEETQLPDEASVFNAGAVYSNTKISAGYFHTCAIVDNGSVACWGSGSNGKLGNGGTSDSLTPTLTSSLGPGRTAVAISAGSGHTCAILDNGSVSCWGSGGNGALGNGGTSNSLTPTLTSSLGIGRTAVAISAGGAYTCALLDNGSVSCWGSGSNGKLGNGGTSNSLTPTLTSSFGSGRTAVAIEVGTVHACAILDNASVSCWGKGTQGQLGNASTSDSLTPTLTSSLGSGRTAVALSADEKHTCAILDNGSVSCWGYAGSGALGNGYGANGSTPTLTSSLGAGRTAVAIASGGQHTCAILDNGSVSCWGYAGSGALGTGQTSGSQTTPILTGSLGIGRTAVAIAAGGAYTCVTLDNGSASCWGSSGWVGGYGQLGNGGTADKYYPTAVSGSDVFDSSTGGNALTASVEGAALTIDQAMTDITFQYNASSSSGSGGSSSSSSTVFSNSKISAGFSHTCAIVDNGSVSCWGSRSNGKLGNGVSSGTQLTPTLTSSLGAGRTAVAISAGSAHTCVILDNGSVSCWGYGTNGRLGNGGTTQKSTPTLTSSLGTNRTAVAISAGSGYTCAILDNGSVSCWGEGALGRLGNGGTSDSHTPTLVSSLGLGRTAVAISAKGNHACAILDNGSVSCWGAGNYGKLGNGGTTESLSPTLTSSLGPGRTAVAISTYDKHTCAILDNGSVSCWGYGGAYQLGNGISGSVTAPTLTLSLGANRTAVALATGNDHTCAILDNGSVSCWGSKSTGKLGSGGTTGSQPTPTLTGSLGAGRTAVAIAAGYAHTCVTLDNDSASCWGWGGYGQLGNGGTGDQDYPTAVSGSDVFNSSTGTVGGMTDLSGATCSISPALPSGLSITQGTCVISGTPLVGSSNTTYTVTAILNSVTYQATVWLSATTFNTLTSTVDGAALSLGEAMAPITLNYTAGSSGSGSGSGSGNGSGSGSGNGSGSSSTMFSNSKLSAASSHTCVILDNGSVACFGTGNSGRLGNGGLSDALSPTLTSSLGAGRTAVAISNGGSHTCALLDNGSVSCWGNGGDGRLGNGNTTNSLSPNLTGSLGVGRTAIAISAGAYHTCAILDNGSVSCWGQGSYGQLGHGSGANALTPTLTSSLGVNRTAVAISAGTYHTCAILDNGLVSCWGKGEKGPLGNGGTAYQTTPTLTSSLGAGRTAVAIDSGGEHTCAILDNGSVSCWGFGSYGAIGNGNTTYRVLSPTLTSSLGAGRTAVAITAGSQHTCAILDNGSASCWGEGANGRLGNVSTSDQTTPTLTSSLGAGRTAVAIAAGGIHTCVIIDNGSFSCWGYGYNGQLGNGGTGSSNTPTPGSGGNTFNNSTGTPSAATWEVEPTLPSGLSLAGGIISGTPSVYATNQTYTVYANQSGYSTTIELWFTVDTDNPHTIVDGQTIDAIGFHTPFWNGTTLWAVVPALPTDLVLDAATGEITGTMNQTLANTTFTVTATHSGSATETFSFNLVSLADYDGDGLANELPIDYNSAEQPTSGLVADDDDDADGLLDSVETNTGIYIDGTDTGTDPLNPDTDDDGICDGPNAVPPICIAGPDPDPNGVLPPATLVGVNNTAINTLAPYMSISGGTYEISPNLPATLSLDANNGEISGTPTETLANTTFTVWVNHSGSTSLSWDFTVELLEDTDGDGMPNVLPSDYDSSNPDSPGLVEDTDDDNDGISDIDEQNDGTNPLHPDTDGDGMCDGEIASTYFDPNCGAGPDAFPTDPSADTDTDGDGDPDTLNPPSNSDPVLVEDLDDDGDGLDDVNETNTGIANGDTDTGTDPLNPDSDFDGICDGPIAVPPICIAGPDETPLGQPAEGVIYALNNSQMSSLVPSYQLPAATWEISPDLPAGITIDATSGIISGTPTEIIGNTTFTIYGNATGSTISFDFNLQVLEDTDRDGEPNQLPIDYPEDGELIEDLDDDGDGAPDLSETGTGFYNGTDDMGTDPLDPDTDDDGICDGPNDVLPICIGGPDSNPFGTGPLGPTVLVNNTLTTPLPPANAVPGATWEISPALPEGLVLDTNTGIISGTPTQTLDNTTFTVWANTTTPSMSIVSTFWLEVLEDSDGDGMPDSLPEDYPETNPPYDLVEDLDDDNDGMSDLDEDLIGTDPTDPDTDGDGFCDGQGTGDGDCYAGPDSAPLDPLLPVNTDGDAYPDIDPDGEGGLIADDDDDNDGFLDTREVDCASDPLNATDMPTDMDGDGICDEIDDDIDGDGLYNVLETNSSIYNSTTDTGTDSLNADTDGDGVCDGPASPVTSNCTAGPDAFPNDPAAYTDTDGDGFPDNLYGNSTSEPPLVLDLDDDGDDWSDLDEVACGTDPPDATSVPTDEDSDGICDALDEMLDLPFTLTYPSNNLELTVGDNMAPLLPNLTGLGGVATWEISGDLPEGLTFGWSPARDAMLDGSIRGIPSQPSTTMTFTIWANNSVHSESFDISLTILEEIESDDGFSWMWCFPFLIFLLLVLLIPLILQRERILLLLADGPEPENTTSLPEFVSGAGTEDDPFILQQIKDLEPGDSAHSIEVITITNMSDVNVEMIDFNQQANGNKFSMFETSSDEIGTRSVAIGENGEITINILFDDSRGRPTFEGGEYSGLLKLGRASVYLSWSVTVKKNMSQKNKYEKAAKEAKFSKKEKVKAEADTKAAENKAAEKRDSYSPDDWTTQMEVLESEGMLGDIVVAKADKAAETKSAKEAKARAAEEKDAKAKATKATKEAKARAAEEKDAKAKDDADAKNAKAKAAKSAKATEEKDAKAKATKEAKAKDDADSKAAKADKATKAKDAKSAKATEEKDAKDAKAKDAKATKAKTAEAKSVSKEEKKQAELMRVKSNASSIDFATLGIASASDKDNLQDLKGVGPFIEEKLNALGIYRFEQLAKMTSEIEEEVNIAIEFFPGRVKRDQWAKQAKDLKD